MKSTSASSPSTRPRVGRRIARSMTVATSAADSTNGTHARIFSSGRGSGSGIIDAINPFHDAGPADMQMLRLDRAANAAYETSVRFRVGPPTARPEPRQARKGATVEKSGCDGPFPFCARTVAFRDWVARSDERLGRLVHGLAAAAEHRLL